MAIYVTRNGIAAIVASVLSLPIKMKSIAIKEIINVAFCGSLLEPLWKREWIYVDIKTLSNLKSSQIYTIWSIWNFKNREIKSIKMIHELLKAYHFFSPVSTTLAHYLMFHKSLNHVFYMKLRPFYWNASSSEKPFVGVHCMWKRGVRGFLLSFEKC